MKFTFTLNGSYVLIFSSVFDASPSKVSIGGVEVKHTLGVKEKTLFSLLVTNHLAK
jgi:hypothetical protein